MWQFNSVLEEMYKCEFCNKEFDTNFRLSCHKNGAHKTPLTRTKERVIIYKKCKRCQTEFSYQLTKDKDGTINHKRKERQYCKKCSNARPKNMEMSNMY